MKDFLRYDLPSFLLTLLTTLQHCAHSNFRHSRSPISGCDFLLVHILECVLVFSKTCCCISYYVCVHKLKWPDVCVCTVMWPVGLGSKIEWWLTFVNVVLMSSSGVSSDMISWVEVAEPPNSSSSNSCFSLQNEEHFLWNHTGSIHTFIWEGFSQHVQL